MLLLDGSPLAGLKHLRSGKVREVYDLGTELLLVATDRISAFDVVMANGIPNKGRILNTMSAFWFAQLRDVIPNHIIDCSTSALEERAPGQGELLAGRSVICRKTQPLPVECVARGYITGSLYKDYKRDGSGVNGLDLPDGLLDGSRLPEPIFTPATKAEEGHDENISFKQMADIIGLQTAEKLRDTTLSLYSKAAEYALTKGLILADTKFEFGWDGDELVWIDEALTPDSSRYWDLENWAPGQQQPSFDKQFVRDYLEQIQWNKQPPGPTLPNDVVEKTEAKYREAFRKVVGVELEAYSLE